jgi:hypothetical protein
MGDGALTRRAALARAGTTSTPDEADLDALPALPFKRRSTQSVFRRSGCRYALKSKKRASFLPI